MSPTARLVSGNAAEACVRQWVRISDAVESVPDRAFDIVTRLPGWRVQELVTHLIACVVAVPDRLAEPAPERSAIDLPGYLLALSGAAAAISHRERGAAAGSEPALLKHQLREGISALTTALARTDSDRVVATRFGGMRFADFIGTRCIEGVVHGLDLATAIPAVSISADPDALKVATKGLLAALTVKAPGKSVEMRVPPIAAVQCVEGPRHTRGTPPNVVETDPASWIELATGRLAWATARDDGRLRASGERSDISGLLPLL